MMAQEFSRSIEDYEEGEISDDNGGWKDEEFYEPLEAVSSLPLWNFTSVRLPNSEEALQSQGTKFTDSDKTVGWGGEDTWRRSPGTSAGPGYSHDKYSLAWAQAVQNRPDSSKQIYSQETSGFGRSGVEKGYEPQKTLAEVCSEQSRIKVENNGLLRDKKSEGQACQTLEMSDSKHGRKVIGSSIHDIRLEEGEIEEGEIELKFMKEHPSSAEKLSEIGSSLEQNSQIRKAQTIPGSSEQRQSHAECMNVITLAENLLRNVSIRDAQRSLADVYETLQSALKILVPIFGQSTDVPHDLLHDVQQKMFDGLRAVNAARSTGLAREQEYDKATFPRLMGLATTHCRKLFTADQIKELDSMMQTVPSQIAWRVKRELNGTNGNDVQSQNMKSTLQSGNNSLVGQLDGNSAVPPPTSRFLTMEQSSGGLPMQRPNTGLETQPYGIDVSGRGTTSGPNSSSWQFPPIRDLRTISAMPPVQYFGNSVSVLTEPLASTWQLSSCNSRPVGDVTRPPVCYGPAINLMHNLSHSAVQEPVAPFKNYTTSSVFMSDLPSPTPSEEDTSARYTRGLAPEDVGNAVSISDSTSSTDQPLNSTNRVIKNCEDKENPMASCPLSHGKDLEISRKEPSKVLNSRDPRRQLVSLLEKTPENKYVGTRKRDAGELSFLDDRECKRHQADLEVGKSSAVISTATLGTGGWLDPDVEMPSEMEVDNSAPVSLEDDKMSCTSHFSDELQTTCSAVINPIGEQESGLDFSLNAKDAASNPTSDASTQQALIEDGLALRMKPRDPRRILLETTSKNEQPITNMETPVQAPNIPPHLMSKLASLVKMVGSSKSITETIPLLTAAPIADTQLVGSKFLEQLAPDSRDVLSMSNNSANQDISQSLPTDKEKLALEPVITSELHPELENMLKDLSESERLAFQQERSRRMEEQERMLSARKLCLVLDLDHTLLNSAKFLEVEPEWETRLRAAEAAEKCRDGREGVPRRELYRFPHMGMWTKLRPGIWRFLARASQLYELHVYTMGNKAYATEMAKLLDPTGTLFAGRVISKGDDLDSLDGEERIPKSKDLDGVLGMESAVVIIDDSVRVWPHHRENLIVVERYMYFPCSRRQFGLPGPSLLEVGHDEREADGMLSSILGVIDRIHQNFFAHEHLGDVDVRVILSSVQHKVLHGCIILFSRIFPVGEVQPHLHPLWRMAEQFGAVCTTRVDEEVTHVVAISLGTDKVNWALATGRFVVRPAWLEASTILYRRANERDYPVPP